MIDYTIPSAVAHARIIRQKLSDEAVYEQLAEEASELAQAASKMARVLRGENPTPKTKEEAYKDVVEEYTDLEVVAHCILDINPDWFIGDYKLLRWAMRLEGLDGDKGQGPV